MTDNSETFSDPYNLDPSQEALAALYSRWADYAACRNTPDVDCEHMSTQVATNPPIHIYTTTGNGQRRIPNQAHAVLTVRESHSWFVGPGQPPVLLSESHVFAGTFVPAKQVRLDDLGAAASRDDIAAFAITAKSPQSGHHPSTSITWIYEGPNGERQLHTCTIQLNPRSGIFTLRRPESQRTQQAPFEDALNILNMMERTGILIRPRTLAEPHLPKHGHR